jgi:thioredoxin-like negative regulator of GroEL
LKHIHLDYLNLIWFKDLLLEEENARKAAVAGTSNLDVREILDDPDLERLHAERLASLKQEAEKRAEMEKKGHGSYEDVVEGDFLEIVTKTPSVVAHFYHPNFERCRVMDKHLAILARKYFDTRFIKISAPDAPFFVEKLNVKMLPCLICFFNGVAGRRLVGFDELGGKDDFQTELLEDILKNSSAVKEAIKASNDEAK